MNYEKSEKYEVLKRYFGYDSFREGQEILIDGILDGRDVLGIMPTGSGKSLCYQVPALILPGITLVVSPLISLMKDQVTALNQAGVHAAYLNSSLTTAQYYKALGYAREGRYPIIYVAPERLMTETFLDFAMHVDIAMLAIDEAHCISQWGQDFRPSYLKIVDFIEKLPRRPVVSAFTATATKEVRDDIIDILQLQNPVMLTTGFDRKNLYFAVETPKDRYAAIRAYLEALLDKKAFDRKGLIYGMGHAVYTNSDPREVILKRFAKRLSEEKGMQREFALYELVEKEAGELIMHKRKLFKPVCANVDFYSGFVYSMLGIPEELFTPIFAIARISGWCAHRLEELVNAGKIIRPAYKYVGHHRPYCTMQDRNEGKQPR